MFFDDLNLAVNSRAKKSKAKEPFVPKTLRHPEIVNIPFEEFTDQELLAEYGKKMAFDIECYPNYFLIAFKSIESKKVCTFELSPDVQTLDVNKLGWIVFSTQLISFNGQKYDRGLLFLAMCGHGVTELKKASDKLILDDNYRISTLEKEYNIKLPILNHIDLIELAPLQASLKLYAGRLNTKRMQDLPYVPDTMLTKEQAENVKYYCVNDLDNTILLFENLKKDIELREQLSAEYGQDLRSYSDAQIAEHVLSSECEKINGYRSRRPKIAPGTQFYYTPPAYVQFSTPKLQEVLQNLNNYPCVISESGSPQLGYLKDLKITLGDTEYRMGIGGLHSCESAVTHFADENYLLVDSDVVSYYPRIILNNGYFPKHLGVAFLDAYRAIVNRRLEAKGLSKSEDEVLAKASKKIADSLKITINGSFGKLGSKYSALYSPDLLIQVTLTGQLSLLMLIEKLELSGVKVVSGNTDGIVIRPHVSQYEQLKSIIAQWEKITGFEMEETQYKATYGRDVNNYIAAKKYFDKASGKWLDEFPDGTKFSKHYKGKRVFGEPDLKKNPAFSICSQAVIKKLIDGVPIETTILECKDINKFVIVRTVKGGAEKDGLYLGKAIRWYYSNETQGTINYVINGNTVPVSEGGKPIMDLPKEFPSDIDYEKYIAIASDMLIAVGACKEKASSGVKLENLI